MRAANGVIGEMGDFLVGVCLFSFSVAYVLRFSGAAEACLRSFTSFVG